MPSSLALPPSNISSILIGARGLAFLRVAKVGMGISAKVGTGIVIARLGGTLDHMLDIGGEVRVYNGLSHWLDRVGGLVTEVRRKFWNLPA